MKPAEGQQRGLVYPDGRPVQAGTAAAIRMRASLSGTGPASSGFGWAYDGAAPRSQTMLNWMPGTRSPDSEINYNRDRMVGRARDLDRNDPWAHGSIRRIADAAVGHQFYPRWEPNWRVLSRHLGPAYDATWAREFASGAVSEWRMWADDPNHWCDTQRRLTFTHLAYQALTTKLIEGDALAMLPWMLDRREPGAARYATTIQMIDPDRLSNPNIGVDTSILRGGVEIDALEAPIAYHIREASPYDYYNAVNSMTWKRIPRETAWGRRVVVHDFDQERATQHRGVSIFAPVLARLRMLARFDDVTLQSAFLKTVMGMFVRSPYDESLVQSALDGGYQAGSEWPGSAYEELRIGHHAGEPIEVNGVRIPTLAPGEDIGLVGGQNHEGENYEAFQSSFLRSVATATGQSTEEISNDFSKLNYSSFRGAMLQAHKRLLGRRYSFTSGFCSPISTAWVEEFCDLHAHGMMPAGFAHDTFVEYRAAFARCEWIAPGRGWVDPVKERQGEVLGLDAGFGTLKDTCANISGVWWEDVLDQRQAEIQAFKERGIPLPQVFRPENASDDDKKPLPA